MEWLAPVVIVGLLVVGLGLFFAVRRMMRVNAASRDDEAGPKLSELARKRGWIYEAENTGFADRIPGYPVNGGRDKKCRQLVQGIHRGRQFGVFHFTTLAGSGGSARHFRVFVVPVVTTVPMPKLLVASAETIHGNPRKNYAVATGDPQFDHACYVASDSMEFARSMLSPTVRELFVTDPRMRELSLRVEFSGEVVYHAYEQKEHLDVSTVEPTLDFLCDLLDRVPDTSTR